MAKNTFNLSGLLVLLSAWLLLGLGQAQAETETITYFHNDIVGTPLLATDAAGKVVWKESYEPYGGRLNNAAGGDNKQWFAGKPHDREIGLTYFGARYYDPVTGRFTGMDPAAIDSENVYGLNRYSYANGNPYKYVDPDGRAPTTVLGGGAGFMVCGPPCAVVGAVVGGLGGAWFANKAWHALHSESSSGDGNAGGLNSSGANSTSPQTPPPDDEEPKRVTNPKHHPNSQSPEPKNVGRLYDNSVADKSGVRWAKDADGEIHRFSKPSNGESHWNGSTGGVDPIQPQNIPVEIRRLLGFKG